MYNKHSVTRFFKTGLQTGDSSLPRKSRCQVKSGLKKIAKPQRKGNLRREINNLKRNSLKKNKKKTTDAEPPSHPAFQDCRSINEFQYLNRIDEGAFGVVHRARDRQTGEEVALKQLKNINQREGLSIAARRELEILIKMKHPNIVAGGGIAVNSLGEEVFIVMEYVDYDLKSFLETMCVNGQMFSTEHVKCLMTQLLRAVQHLHDHQIIHRDMKTSNVLLSGNGVLKVADFGLARECESTPRQYTPGVVTRWYRAPELLLLSSEYSTPIDMWSVGCIFVELITLQPLFPGKSEVDQLDKVFKELGTPSDTIWPGFSALPLAKNIVFHNYPPGGLRKRINDGKLSCSGFSLLHGLLAYDPAKRMTAFNASEHGFFKEDPVAIEPAEFLTEYFTPVDMWSVGCIFAELITLQPLFPDTTEVDQLDRIFKELETPSETIWTGYNALPIVQHVIFDSGRLTEEDKRRKTFGLWFFFAARRMTAAGALELAYFKEELVAIEPDWFPMSMYSVDDDQYSGTETEDDISSHSSSTVSALDDNIIIAKHQRKGNLRREINNLNQNSLKKNKEKTTDAGPPSLPAFQDCRSVDEFQYLNRIDEGAFGVVHRAKDRLTGEEVALKQLKKINQREGLSIAARRELEILIKMKHPNIVTGGGIAVNSLGEEVFIVMEYVDYDLKSFLETMRVNGQMFTTEHVKCLMTQLLRAVQHLHDHLVMHRDIKTNNVLLSRNGVLKVADFGMARAYESPPRQYTPGVVTRWYRAPEILLLSREYSTPVDMWSVGCILAELFTLQPLFPGTTEVEQLDKIFKELGTPSEAIWSGFKSLPIVQHLIFNSYAPGGLRKKIGRDTLSDCGFCLLQGLLTYNPLSRTTAADALEHEYFKEEPVAIEPSISVPHKSRRQVKCGLKKIAKNNHKGKIRREEKNLKQKILKKKTEVKQETSVTKPPFHPCRSVDEFQYLNRIDEGAFGVVHRARDRQTGEEVALKQLKKINQKEGFSIAAQRELDILLKMKHPNIVAGEGIAVNPLGEEIFIIMEYVDYDLKRFLETMRVNGQMFSTEHVKCLMMQLLSAVQHLHDHQVLHRDLKTNNVLISGNGVLKVADFGMARECESPPRQYTPGVVTRWYRAPEILLMSREYSTPIDMWSVGCIFAELITLQPLFPGKSELDQLNKIFRELGTPSDTIWPGFSALPLVRKIVFHNYPTGGLRERINCGRLSNSGLALLQGLLAYDPAKRITIADASEHGFFKEEPVAIKPAEFLRRQINNLKQNSLRKNKEESTDAGPPSHPAFQDCRSVDEFKYLNRIDEGAFGVVHRARDRLTGEESRCQEKSGLKKIAKHQRKGNLRREINNLNQNSLKKNKEKTTDAGPPSHPAFQDCRSVDEFQYLNRIDEGAFGVVHRAKDRLTGEEVALKQLKKINQREGLSIVARRELEILIKMKHPNIVAGGGIAVNSLGEEVFIVMEYVDYDLKSFLETMRVNGQMFTTEHVKCLMTQLLRAVQHLHDHLVMHRDIKTNNVLLSRNGILKVADFGMARAYESPPRQYTPGVVTRWYRAPEILLLSREYSTPVDMWSVGCILAELFTLQPLFPGTTEVEQLDKIFKELGTPSEAIWPDFNSLPIVQHLIFNSYAPGGLRKKIGRDTLSDCGFSLLQGLLTYNPLSRTTAGDALEHEYFKEEPVAIEPSIIDEGAFGVVHRARDRQTGEEVALKQLKPINQREGLSIAARRELGILLKMKHPNIVAGGGIAFNPLGEEVFIVMEYVDYDLKSFLETMRVNGQMFSTEHVKCLLTQLLSAVQHLHDHQVLHRDLKTNNVLLSRDGVVKVADFGLAREYESPAGQYTPGVVTRWYRAPELLLLSSEYSAAIDMWSVGCIFAELVTLQPLFPGKSEMDQLNKIFRELGTPSDTIWPGFSSLPLVKNIVFHNYPTGGLREKINDGKLSNSGLALLEGFLAYDPAKRMTAADAIEHGFFKEEPVAIEPADFLTWPALCADPDEALGTGSHHCQLLLSGN
ncbi:hypothetical protein HW555_001255 [Spodoptera exigua]|uniref:Protein kinase domain-containing protein n=1 Tax=Spodoptera exigua TaxID=7107 RepID=A0A835GR04_SPOEX|nr:hypothetical protein HW555_001255 [Spodoptera exigua]